MNLSSASTRPWVGQPFDIGSQGSALTVYGASKAALDRISNVLGAEFYGSGIRVNTVEPSAAVLSEGADVLVGRSRRPDQIESMEQVVEGTVVLCCCDADIAGCVTVSLDNIDNFGLAVHGLDACTGGRSRHDVNRRQVLGAQRVSVPP